MSGNDPADWTYQCTFSPDRLGEETLLEYILAPEAFVEATAEAYWQEEQEQLLYTFLARDMAAEAYAEFMNHPEYSIHAVKRIREAVEKSSAKTVTVTIDKGGEEFAFKFDAFQLTRDCTSNYSDWYIAAADRKRFELRYGRNEHFTPLDILRIEYARKVIYEREGA
jgi:hypothetical protein